MDSDGKKHKKDINIGEEGVNYATRTSALKEKVKRTLDPKKAENPLYP